MQKKKTKCKKTYEKMSCRISLKNHKVKESPAFCFLPTYYIPVYTVNKTWPKYKFKLCH